MVFQVDRLMRRLGRLSVACGLAGAAFATDVATGSPVFSGFDIDGEGWFVSDLNCSNYGNVLDTLPVVWSSSGGAPGGHISRFDPSNNCFFFDAPSSFLGDQSARVGGSLRFSLRTTDNEWLPGSVVVLIGDNGIILVHDTPQPDNIWRTYRVPLTASAFRFNTSGGSAVSDAQFLAVMGDLEAVRISGEYGSIVEETTSLDSVCWRSAGCNADLNCDNTVGVVDLLMVINDWGPGAHKAGDVDDDGSVGVPDLLAIINSWGPCP